MFFVSDHLDDGESTADQQDYRQQPDQEDRGLKQVVFDNKRPEGMGRIFNDRIDFVQSLHHIHGEGQAEYDQ